MSTVEKSVYVSAFTIDFSAARVDPDTGDWVSADLCALMGQEMATTATIALHAQTGHPRSLVYVINSAHLRVLAGRFRLAGQPAEYVESDLVVGEARQAFDRLLIGSIRALIARRAYVGGPPITGIDAVILVRPTRIRDAFLAFLQRLEVNIVIDVGDNIRRLGTPDNWRVSIIEGKATDTLRDPYLDRLATMSTREIQKWAEGNPQRLELGRVAKNFNPGWVRFAQEGWLNRQVKSRGGPTRSDEPRPARNRT
jgi:hypothetical protein